MHIQATFTDTSILPLDSELMSPSLSLVNPEWAGKRKHAYTCFIHISRVEYTVLYNRGEKNPSILRIIRRNNHTGMKSRSFDAGASTSRHFWGLVILAKTTLLYTCHVFNTIFNWRISRLKVIHGIKKSLHYLKMADDLAEIRIFLQYPLPLCFSQEDAWRQTRHRVVQIKSSQLGDEANICQLYSNEH